MEKEREAYPSDLTDAQWALIEPLIPPPKSGSKAGGRTRTVNMREVINGILYLLRSVCSWRMLPHDLPPWGTVHYYYRRWRMVHVASLQDRDGARLVLEKLRGRFPRLRLIWADGGYAGKLIDWVKDTFGWVVEVVKRYEGAKGFQILPRRWIVERTFGWLGRYRRLSKDYEASPESSEAMIYIAMIHLMLHRLVPG